MAVQAKAIKQKIKGVGNIRKITRTMEMVSVSKMKKATGAALLLRPYAKESYRIIESIISGHDYQHRFFVSPPHAHKTLYIVVASSKGLCGSYNTNVYRELSRQVRGGSSLEAITIGKQAEKIAKRLSLPIVASYIDWGDTVDYARTSGVTQMAIDLFSRGEYKHIYIVYTDFIKAMEYKPTTKQLLPIEKTVMKKSIEDIEGESSPRATGAPAATKLYEPTANIVLDTILPRLLESIVHHGVLEGAASEHSSRMFAMKTATDNAKEMLDDLKITYNKARQDAVTQELAEIAGGAGAI